MLLSALVGVSLYVLITYDIACQYFKAFWTRICGLPARLRPTFDHNKLTVKVPKGHIRAHDDSCYGPYSLNYTEGAGETDGEGIERLWSWLNKAAPSAKEMTPAARHELLDDFCNFTNWRKTRGLCDILARRMLEALKQAQVHRDEYITFNTRVRVRAPQELQEWQRMVTTWRQDHTRACPYTHTQPRTFFLLCMSNV